MMRTSYDPEADAFYARFAPEGVKVERTQEVAPNVMIDFDTDGDVVGIEVLGVRARGRKAARALVAGEPAAE